MTIDYPRERANMCKRIRSEVRLKHSLAADDELREVLPRLMAEFELSIQQGVLPQLNPGTLSLSYD